MNTKNAMLNSHLLVMHTLAKIGFNDKGELLVSLIDIMWLEDYLRDHPNELKSLSNPSLVLINLSCVVIVKGVCFKN